jgi:hypothetical protein
VFCAWGGAGRSILRSVCAVGLGAGDLLTTHLTSQCEAGAHVELPVNECIECGMASLVVMIVNDLLLTSLTSRRLFDLLYGVPYSNRLVLFR